jgi:MurNAc alpha-1-phosphate uridylyltransferase
LQAVILAGGLGTRLRPITDAIPKTMVPVEGRPFLEYELELLRKGGVDDFVICVGHLGEMVEGHFGDGRKFGTSIRYSQDGPLLLGPAGALKRAEHLLDDSFFVIYGDAYLRAPYRPMMRSLVSSGNLGLMAVYRNDNRHGRSDVAVRGGAVVRYDKKGGTDLHWINYGVTALRREALGLIPGGSTFGEEQFYGSMIAQKELGAFPVTKRFYEIGSPDSLREFARFISR